MIERISKEPQIPELQTLRGLAALLVAVSHICLVYELPRPWRLGIDTVLNAHAAVVLFFVLSGYVLTASLVRSGPTLPRIAGYYVRRLFRIYPAVWVASALSIGVILTVGSPTISPAASRWFSGYMDPATLSPKTVTLSLLALKNTLIVPIGTILTELVGSFVLPAFIMLAIWRPRALPLLLLALAAAVFVFARAPLRLDSLSYLFDFAVGMAVFMVRERWQAVVAPRAGGLALAAIAALLLCRQPYYMLVSGGPQPIYFDYAAPLPSLIEGVASGALIAAVATFNRRWRWLAEGPLARLGDISYSVYLLHFPIMALIARTLSPIATTFGLEPLAATGILLGATLAPTILLSFASYQLIEKPGLGLGKQLALRLISGRPVAASA